MVEWLEAHLPLALAGVFSVLAVVLAAQASRLLAKVRANAGLNALDTMTGLIETWSRQGVRYAEEAARKLGEVKMPADEKRYLAVEFVKEQAKLAGFTAGTDEEVASLVEGSLAAERKFLEEFTIDAGEIDPAMLDAILEGERDLAAGRVTRLEDIGKEEPDGPGEAGTGAATPTG